MASVSLRKTRISIFEVKAVFTGGCGRFNWMGGGVEAHVVRSEQQAEARTYS